MLSYFPLSSFPNNPSWLLFGVRFPGFLLFLFLDLIAVRESWLFGCLLFIAYSIFVLLVAVSYLLEFLSHCVHWLRKIHKGYFYVFFFPSLLLCLELPVAESFLLWPWCWLSCQVPWEPALTHRPESDLKNQGKPSCLVPLITVTFVLWICPACL